MENIVVLIIDPSDANSHSSVRSGRRCVLMFRSLRLSSMSLDTLPEMMCHTETSNRSKQ